MEMRSHQRCFKVTFTERRKWSEGQTMPVSERAALQEPDRERADAAHETETILERGHTQRGGQPGTVEQELGATP